MSITPEEDYHAWALRAARHAREGLLTAEELAQVAEDMAKSERRELKSRLAILLAHLLKWKYQSEAQSYSVSLSG